MKRIIAAALAVLLGLAAGPVPFLTAAAETTGAQSSETAGTTETTAPQTEAFEKSYIAQGSLSNLMLSSSPDRAMFWEGPYLEPGQYKEGRFYLKNETAVTLAFRLNEIHLPYDDKETMAYLMQLHTVIRTDAGETVYDGPFGGIMEKDGLRIVIDEFKPGEVRAYDISMRCAFSYAGEARGTGAAWEFFAMTSHTQEQQFTGLWGTMKLVGFITAGFIVLVVVLYIVRWIVKSRRRASGRRGEGEYAGGGEEDGAAGGDAGDN